jgi:FkbM family methyltransferase
MLQKLSYIFYKIIFYFDKLFIVLTRRSLLVWLKDYLQKDAYKSIQILNKQVNFFIPNHLTNSRVDTFFIKEPETIEWINSFENSNNLIFWDIGANIGLYSIYNALKNSDSLTVSFEPSTSNLRVLSRNISINDLENKIQIVSLPLTNKENQFLMMKEGEFSEGGALNSFGESWNYAGNDFKSEMNYKLLGTTINYLLDHKILEVPDHIKIDVDGIEHLILEGADKYLRHKKIKSLSIEINENFQEQYDNILSIMKKNDFEILHKKHNEAMFNEECHYVTFNYVFIRKEV